MDSHKNYVDRRVDKNAPLVSIITAVFNCEEHIEKTIKSVLSLDYKNVEYIIIDGNSTDQTVDIIKKYESSIYYWVSEKDKGIGDAWNKGLNVSRGKIIGFLNAGDLYERDNIEKVLSEIDCDDLVITYGRTIFIDKNGLKTGENYNQIFKHSFYSSIYRGFGFYHTSCFVTKKVYNEVGTFNPDIKIAVDTDFLIRAYKKSICFKQIPTITYMRMGGISQVHAEKAYEEYSRVLKNHGFNKIKIWFWKKINKVIFNLKRINYNIYLQMFFIAVWLFNFLYNCCPFFYIKKILLLLSGIKIGRKSYIHSWVKFFHFGRIVVGNNSTINFGCYLDNRRKITIGNNVSIAHNTKIYTLGHDINDAYFCKKGSPVRIGDYVCIFSNVIINPGVRIGTGAVVLAGAVVTKDVPDYHVVGGNPAKFIKERSKELKYTLDYGFWFAQ